MKTLLLVISLLAIVLLSACSSSDTNQTQNQDRETDISLMLVHYDIDDLVRESDCILIGKVVEILPARGNETGMSEDQVERGMDIGFRVYTDVLIQPEQVLFGELNVNDLIGVRVWGGQIGETKVIVEGEATFSVGDESLLSLYTPDAQQTTPVPDGIKPTSYFSVKGFEQGKYEYKDGIATNSRTGGTIAISDLVEKISSLHE